MPLTITEYAARVREVLQSGLDYTLWYGQLPDAGLRQALLYLSEHLPPAETTLACAAGREQDISAVAGLLGVAGVGWPWADDEDN